MSFLSVAFLFALPLVAAPLLLHLFDRRRNETVQWGAMQFLMEASARKTSSRKLKQWLLLLLRCLAIAALILALARPLLPTGYLGGSEQGETIFVIDNSMSMSRKTGSGTMIEAAAEYAVDQLEKLSARDEVRILTTAPYPTWLNSGSVHGDRSNRDWITEQLRAIDATEGRSDLLAALYTAVQVEHQPTQNVRRIVVLTDGQSTDWRTEDEAGWQRFHAVLNEATVRTEIETVRLEQQNPGTSTGNVAVDAVTLNRTVVGSDTPVTAVATLHNYDVATMNGAELTWSVNDQPLHQQTIAPIEGEQTTQANWSHTFDSPGIYRLSCRLDRDDDLPADNVASLVVEVVDRLPVVIVEGAADQAEMQQDTYFVQAALGWIHGQPLTESSIYVPTLVSPDELPSMDLREQRVVIIPNLTELPSEAVSRLTEFVSDGGGLWIGLGPRTNVDFFNHQLFADASGLAPRRLDRIVDASPAKVDSDANSTAIENGSSTNEHVRIDPFRSDHPATRHLADNEQLDLADTSIQRYYQFADNLNADDRSTLLRLNNGSPLAIENFVGQGRVIVQSVPLRLQWSDLARTQSFVVMVRDWIDYLAQPRATQYNLLPGQPIVARVSTNASDSNSDGEEDLAPTGFLHTPEDESIELTAQYADEGFEFRSSQTRRPGPYNLQIGLAETGIPFQVQRSSEESNLSSLGRGAWQRIVAATTPHTWTEDRSPVASSHTDPVWPILLLVLIGLITGELVLSGIMSRERFGSAGIPESSELDASQLNPLRSRDSDLTGLSFESPISETLEVPQK
ncbi:BatA domain-containing protein [Rhodopirellula sp. P2]|uniref:BatA domain-containing protein n=1 Tax=Rhodopirellula sp. P2 TaxID=2127060 RepID=UPI0023675B29|nr:BatA domain-containing protein [Rhodopirellula sp. P2]WDQ16286.1 BatA domain-containing protein [Rhodopirellula sp. P2]